MSTKTNAKLIGHDDKAKKASAERVRKAKIKAAASGTAVGTYLTDVNGKFCVAEARPDGTVAVIKELVGLDLDAAKTAAKNPVAAIDAQTPEPESAPEPVEPDSGADVGPHGFVEFTPRNVFLYVFDQFAVSVSDVASAFGVDKTKVKRALKKLESRGVVCSSDVNDEAQGVSRSGKYRELVWQSALGTYDDKTREQAEQSYDELEAAEREVKGSASPRKPRAAAPAGARSQARKLVHEPTGLIVRMSERAQATCIEQTGSLPVIDGVAFVRADGTPADQIVGSDDDE